MDNDQKLKFVYPGKYQRKVSVKGYRQTVSVEQNREALDSEA